MPAKLRLVSLGIGHGDATLAQWFTEEDPDHVAYTVLVDGGESPGALLKALDRYKVEDLDLLVLTHFDADHIGGLESLWKTRRIATYWAPCLPAFQRHEWLFGEKIRSGMKRAQELEGGLLAAGTNVVYPLEGYRSAPLTERGLGLHLLSPAARMIRTLLTSDDVGWLFTQTPTPLRWLGETPPADPVERAPNEIELDRQLLTGALTPEDLRWVNPSPSSPDAGTVRQDWGISHNADPEFFGDSVLNNTSLVFWVDAVTGGRRHRVLLTGDQENWTYLLMKHPLGLKVDVMKAPHHGGRLYIENDTAHEEIQSAVRPQAVLFSANGRHDLPRTAVRESAMRWGASVFCTSERKKEYVSGPAPLTECCHVAHDCSKSTRDVALEFTAEGIASEQTACHSGYGTNPGPVIQIVQHTIQPSPALQHLFEQELRSHMKWVSRQLRKTHAERVQILPAGSTDSRPVESSQLAALARAAKQHVLAFHLPEVLSNGWERGTFWTDDSTSRYRNPAVAYSLPTEEELKKFVAILRGKDLLLFAQAPVRQDPVSMLSELDTQGLAKLGNAHLHFPEAMFRDAFWPVTLKELRTWNCYRHPSGALGLSQCGTPEELYAKLLRSMFSAQNESWDLMWETDWLSAVVLTESERTQKGWADWWFSIDTDYHLRERTKIELAKNGIRLHEGSSYYGSGGPYLKNITEAAIPAAARIFGTLVQKEW